MSRETQATISAWAVETFGPSGSLLDVLTRANDEMAELLRAAVSLAPRERILEEAADAFIVLCRAATKYGHGCELDLDIQDIAGDFSHVLLQNATAANSHLAEAILRAAFSADDPRLFALLKAIEADLHWTVRSVDGDLWEVVDAKMEVNRASAWLEDPEAPGFFKRKDPVDSLRFAMKRAGL